jgi:hypothetical protein
MPRHSLDANCLFSFYGNQIFDENDKLDHIEKAKIAKSRTFKEQQFLEKFLGRTTGTNSTKNAQ